MAAVISFAGLIGSAIDAQASVIDYLLVGSVDTIQDPSVNALMGQSVTFHLFVETNQIGTPGPSGGTFYQASAIEQIGAFKWSTPSGITSKQGELLVQQGPVTDYVEIDLRTIPDLANPSPLVTGLFMIAFKTGLGTLADESLPPLETFLVGKSPWPNSFTLSGFLSGHISEITIASPVSQTPIPAALPLFASALGGLGFVGWRRKRSEALAQRAIPGLSDKYACGETTARYGSLMGYSSLDSDGSKPDCVAR
jgi:hypothetical protein